MYFEGDLPTLKDCSGGREKENRSTNLARHLLWSGENRHGAVACCRCSGWHSSSCSACSGPYQLAVHSRSYEESAWHAANF